MSIDQQNSLTIQRRLIDAFDEFADDILQACAYEKGAGSVPLKVVATFFLLIVRHLLLAIFSPIFSFWNLYMVIRTLRLL